LKRNNIQFDETLRKAELFEIVRRFKPARKQYELDLLALEKGHKIIRLPPYHCHYNPIELIWANVKGTVARKNKLKWRDCLKNLWKKLQRKTGLHVKKIIDQAWTSEGIIEECVENLIINLRNGSSCDESSSCISSEEDSEDLSEEITGRPIDSHPSTSGVLDLSGVEELSNDSE
jgi:hypothetical protein